MHFQVAPGWIEGRDDAWRELIRTRWLKEDEEFAAVARRKAENRGGGGTHCTGKRSFERFKGKMVCIYMELPAFISPHVPT